MVLIQYFLQSHHLAVVQQIHSIPDFLVAQAVVVHYALVTLVAQELQTKATLVALLHQVQLLKVVVAVVVLAVSVELLLHLFQVMVVLV
jgi:hypothetical protein